MKSTKALSVLISGLLLFAVACGGSDADLAPARGGSTGAAAATGPDLGKDSANALPLDEKLIVTTNIELEVEDVRGVYSTISQTARDFGGFVAEAQVSDDQDDPSAFLRLRVPASLHDEVLAVIRGVGSDGVKHEDSRAVEVTAQFTDLQSRLTNLEATEAQYQQLLDRAGSIDEVLQVTARLDNVRSDIEQVQGRLNLLNDQTGFATISVSLSSVAAPAASNLAPPLEVLSTALETSLVVAHATVNGLIVILVAGLWLVPATLVALLTWKKLRRPLETLKAWFQ